MKRLILSILIIVQAICFTEDPCYGLAIPSALQNPEAKKKIFIALEAAQSSKVAKKEAIQKFPISKPKVEPIDKATRLTELLKEERFEGSVLDEAVGIVSRIFEEECISVSSEARLNLLLVMRDLALNPELKAEDIAKKLNIKKDELISTYRLIRDTKPIQDILIRDARYPGLIYLTKELLTNASRIKDILEGKMVYPTIVEWHPGERCNSNCVFCYSRGKNYKDKELGRKPITLERIKELIHEFKSKNKD